MIVRYAGIAVLLMAACSKGGQAGNQPPERPVAARAPDRPSARAAIVFLGTSLTAGYGLPDQSEAYPALIQAKLDSAGRSYRVVNAGVSGESSAGALARIDWLLARDSVAVLVIETGANDGLRGQDPNAVRGRIQAIIDHAKRLTAPPRLIIAGMEALPNLGADYVRRFRAIYPAVARANDALLVPFLLDGVAGIDSLNQDDRIHPTAQGHRIVAENVWKAVEQVTRR